MRYALIFFSAPITVLGLGIESLFHSEHRGHRVNQGNQGIARPETGPLCCGQSVADPTNTCSGLNLNSFCCSDRPSNVGIGCNNLARFPVGRQVQAFASSEVLCDGVGFIGCA
ncbi:uncharacterized protein LY79DRAFT_531715 [Colletotrichum navitas]|uniref:Hydrophobin n=1 Tax=Colletotrichum navitas TaxID=681940 RepID=A0AAD8PI01_9PEZI|nr:uncharacterized protein LY79DRAFT_531715 [Colletotrichum navitas]KAK1561262.1 hypothetical protein LY79DRAFT_531715 [Colletotrichum navitas]